MKEVWLYIKNLPIFVCLFILAACMMIIDRAERAHWKRYAKLRMGQSDGYHQIVNGRCRTK